MVELDISIIFAGLSIAASVVYYASVLQNANKARDRALALNTSKHSTK
jgi:predicted small secreted protein